MPNVLSGVQRTAWLVVSPAAASEDLSRRLQNHVSSVMHDVTGNRDQALTWVDSLKSIARGALKAARADGMSAAGLPPVETVEYRHLLGWT
jgi:hypothetical protein